MFSVLKKIEPKFVNELLKKDPALFDQYKNITKTCIENIQNAINRNTNIDVDEFRNILIACQIKENLKEPYQNIILDIVKHSIEEKNLINEVFENFQFTTKGILDVLKILTNSEHKIALEYVIQNSNLFQNALKTAKPEIIVETLLSLLQLSKQNNLTEESVANFSFYQYDFWLKNFSEGENSLFSLMKTLQNQLDWMIKSGTTINFESLKNYLKNFHNTEITFSDIISLKFKFKEQLSLFKMLKQQQDFEKVKICNYIKSNYSGALLKNTYQLFTTQQIIDTSLLQQIESTIQNQQINIYDLLQFYSTFPLSPSWNVAQILRTSITSQWEKYPISSQLDIVGYLFRIERLTSKPIPSAHYLILDTLLINKIEEMILGLRFQDLGQVDRFKVYFLLNCYFSKDLLSSYFNTQYALYIQAYLNNQFKTQPRIQSNLQKSVEESLTKSNITYQREVLVDNCFAVDFKIKNTIIEVNGPHHYCQIISEKLPTNMITTVSSNQAIYETLKTSLKTQILQQKGYKVINVPYFKWAGWSVANKQDKILNDMLYGLSIKDSELFN